MAEVTKKQIVRWTLNGKRVAANTAGAVKTVELSAKWYGTVNGKPVPLCSDKGKAQKMFAALFSRRSPPRANRYSTSGFSPAAFATA